MNQKIICPKCGSSQVKPIQWGQAKDPEDQDHFFIGGCCKVPELDHGCNNCGHRWGITTFIPDEITEIVFLEKDLETKNKKFLVLSLPQGLAQSSCGNTWNLTREQLVQIRELILPKLLRPLYIEPFSESRKSILHIKGYLPDGRVKKIQVDVPGDGLGQIYQSIFGEFEEK